MLWLWGCSGSSVPCCIELLCLCWAGSKTIVTSSLTKLLCAELVSVRDAMHLRVRSAVSAMQAARCLCTALIPLPLPALWGWWGGCVLAGCHGHPTSAGLDLASWLQQSTWCDDIAEASQSYDWISHPCHLHSFLKLSLYLNVTNSPKSRARLKPSVDTQPSDQTGDFGLLPDWFPQVSGLQAVTLFSLLSCWQLERGSHQKLVMENSWLCMKRRPRGCLLPRK